MAKKNDKKKIAKAKPAAKPVKKATKPTPKKASKPAPKKVVAKPAKKVAKPAPKKAVAKPVAKKIEKKVAKPAPKKIEKVTSKKPVVVKKTTGKPIDAIAKKGAKPSKKVAKSSKKGKKSDDDDEDDIPEEEEDDSDVDVKDDYEKSDDDDIVAEVELDEAGLVDLEGAPAEIDDDDDEIPEKRGRGRRKKNDGKSSGGSMESYIRNRPLQIDINKPLIKKSAEIAPKPFINTKDDRTRYTDKELAEFKELILVKLKEAQADYDLLKQTLSNEDDHGTDDTSPTFKLLEDGSDVMSKEETAQLAQRQEKYIVNLKNALVRIENKTYGICRVTGKLIPKERLRSVPHATLGIDAKLNQTN
jgi:DnaK suppressor protein